MLEQQKRPSLKRRDWWKTAFFVLLVIFELTREVAVLAEAKGAVPNGTAVVSSYEGFVTAKGRWTRVDGGEHLMPALVTIDCRRDLGRCIEASVVISNQYVYSPEIDWFEAKFSEDAVTYENDNPDCARYAVRIDLRLKKTFAVRERKDEVGNANCAKLERRIEMQLGDPYERIPDPDKGHFVPIFSLIRGIFNRACPDYAAPPAC